MYCYHQVEITASNLSQAKIWQKHKHRDADTRVLCWSRRMRHQAIGLSRLESSTAAQVMKCK